MKLAKICDEIDKAILNALPTSGLKAYGLCELINKGNQQHPVTHDLTRQPAQINDRFDGIFYHRLLSIESNEDEEISFGVDILDRSNARLRIFLAHKVHLGEGFVMSFKNAIPSKITSLPLDFKFIHRSIGVTINTDHEGVYNQEYGETTPYERHRTTYNIYALEFNLDFVEC
jgi:hypothetical protein